MASNYRAGAAVSWEALYAGRKIEKVSLPTYPFQRQRYWFRETPQLQVDPEILYEVRWERRAEEPAPTGWAGQWLILCDRGGLGAALARELEVRGAKCELAMRGGEFQASGRKVVHLWSARCDPGRDNG